MIRVRGAEEFRRRSGVSLEHFLAPRRFQKHFKFNTYLKLRGRMQGWGDDGSALCST